ncbi:hypothetical protein [Phytohabitans houttuyneae]|uniref:Uncharacterized protein n=1 Tax=Phytohabitans houttuyneae TaxID=1076126 RepID=A0A6V8KBZ6_9ACTN|nr:hypothetical protein [Phytohabitans houttuyneae]GFJ79516.1 hypothetical protein Phou_036960 [Phytohabitans houttuyneae]
MTTRPRVWLDCETVSLDPDRRAWEVALIHRGANDPSTDTEWSWFVNIDDLDLPSTADPEALEIGGFWRRHPQAAEVPLIGRLAGVVPDLPATAPEGAVWSERTVMSVAASWTKGKAIIHGSNPAFDMHTLAPRMAVHGIVPEWYYRGLDVADRAAGWLAGAGRPVPTNEQGDEKSDLIAAACGLALQAYERHTALGDCRLFRDLWDVIQEPPARPDADALAALVADIEIMLNQRTGHAHTRPGIWDPDNRPGKANTVCVECAARRRVRAWLDGQAPAESFTAARAAVRAVFERSNEYFGGDTVEELDAVLDGALAEYADKAAGSFRRENEALFTGAATPNVQFVTLKDLLTVTSALREVLGFEGTPVATEIVDAMRAERAAAGSPS